MALTRRQFLGAAAAGATVALSGGYSACGSAAAGRGTRSVIVVGAGLAGLTAAYELTGAGFDVTVIEARDRIGGRAFTLRDGFEAGQHGEGGGEAIDLVHRQMLALCRRFELPLENTRRGFAGLEDVVLYGGERIPLSRFRTPAVGRDVARFYRAVYALARRVEQRDPPASAPGLDHRSVGRLIDYIRPGDRGRFYLENYVREDFAAEPEDLSLLYLIAAEKAYRSVPESKLEVYRIAGGNSQLPQALAAELRSPVVLSAPVDEITQSSAGVAVTAAGSRHDADWCVIAAPTPALRNIELAASGLSQTFRDGVERYSYGRVTKTLVQYQGRYWRRQGFSGDVYGDPGFGFTWEQTDQQQGDAGILVDYAAAGGSPAFERLTPEARGERAAGLIAKAFPGPDPVIGGASVSWPTEPYTGGAWAAPEPGQMVLYWSALREPAGRIHLAGEHTDFLFPGYMEGAVRSGQRAAAEVIRAAG